MWHPRRKRRMWWARPSSIACSWNSATSSLKRPNRKLERVMRFFLQLKSIRWRRVWMYLSRHSTVHLRSKANASHFHLDQLRTRIQGSARNRIAGLIRVIVCSDKNSTKIRIMQQSILCLIAQTRAWSKTMRFFRHNPMISCQSATMMKSNRRLSNPYTAISHSPVYLALQHRESQQPH